MSAASDDVFRRLEGEKERHLGELEDFLRIPSISSDPAHAGDMERCSRFVLEQLRRAGLEAEIVDDGAGAKGGAPLVYGEWLGAPGRPTVLIYGHYDVQPVDPLEEWRHPPFEPAIEDEARTPSASPSSSAITSKGCPSPASSSSCVPSPTPGPGVSTPAGRSSRRRWRRWRTSGASVP